MRHFIGLLLRRNPSENIIICGDFNESRKNMAELADQILMNLGKPASLEHWHTRQ